MGTIRAEMLKLRRSLGWAVVVLLPVAMVGAGVVNSLAGGHALADGWHTLWLRSVVFYGMFPLALGVAILASLVWRPEHRGGNWSALMSGTAPARRIVGAKTTMVAGMAAGMQLVMLAAVVLVGKVAFALPGMLPARYWLASLVIAIATGPLAALQSALSMLLRSFAAPVAVAFVGAGVSTAALMVAGDAAMISPYAVASRATQLGTGTFADDGSMRPVTVIIVVVAALVLTAVVQTVAAHVLDRRDTRA